jgi:2-keto-4-pentenoate hydratase
LSVFSWLSPDWKLAQTGKADNHQPMKSFSCIPALALTLASLTCLHAAQIAEPDVGMESEFVEENGFLMVEAEDFHMQTETGSRAWYLFSESSSPSVEPDGDPPHLEGASGGAYLEILPDTRRSHGDKLVKGENFHDFPKPAAVLAYKVRINNPGRYYIWARIYSTNTEDNGLHVGLDGEWPASGSRMQWTTKNQWIWGSKQRTEAVHTGVPYQLYLDIDEPGLHTILFSMREDGTEFDKWLMTLDREFPANAIARSMLEGEPVSWPSQLLGPFSIKQAYEFQDRLDSVLAPALGPVAGYKVGYASKAAQAQFGMKEPARASLYLSGRAADGSVLAVSDFKESMFETEVAFTMGESISAPVASIEELKTKVRWIHPALDLSDFRYDKSRPGGTAADMIATGIGAHMFVLGPGLRPDRVDVDALELTLYRNGDFLDSAPASAVMGSPWNSLLWCVNDIVSRGGKVPAGATILTGTAFPAYRASGKGLAGEYVGDCGALGTVTVVID